MAVRAMSVAAVLALVVLLAVQAQGSRTNPVVESEVHRQLYASGTTMADLFERWVEKHGRVYHSLAEKRKRFLIFQDNVYYMHSHNVQQSKSFSMGLNKFSDLTNEEFRSRNLRGYSSSGRIHKLPTTQTILEYENLADLPEAVDWRTEGAVSPIKDQGLCGSCWAFSTTGAIESMKFLTTGQMLDLSEAELMDCTSPPNSGCDGGDQSSSFDYISKKGGLHTENDYPYTMHQGQCHAVYSPRVEVGDYEQVPEKNEAALLQAVSRQPVSVSMDSSSNDFQHYESGVFTGECGDKLDHAVLAVGYGTDENGIDYWIVKNSWGQSWGEDGFFRIERMGSRDPRGKCGINLDSSYPVMQ